MHQRGGSADAEPLLLEAVRIRRGAVEARSVDGLSRSLNDLGVVYNSVRRYADAERVLRESLAIRRSANVDTHRSVGVTANNLAAALYYQGNMDAAVPMQQLAVQGLQASVGVDHQRSVLALSNLATFKRVQGDLAGAEADYRDLAARQTRLQGRSHPVTAHVLTSLAALLTERAAKEERDTLLVEAEALHREALATFELRMGPWHEQVGLALDRLGTVLLLRGRVSDAVAVETRAVAILRAHAPDTSRAVQQAVKRLVTALNQSGDSTGAARTARQIEAR
jgi:tetratricopeptide (TPR) repeat protein